MRKIALISALILAAGWAPAANENYRLTLSFDKTAVRPGDSVKIKIQMEASGLASPKRLTLQLMAYPPMEKNKFRRLTLNDLDLGQVENLPYNLEKEISISSSLGLELGKSLNIDAWLFEQGNPVAKVFPNVASLELRTLLPPPVKVGPSDSATMTLSKNVYLPEETIQGTITVNVENLGGPGEISVYFHCHSEELFLGVPEWSAASPVVSRPFSRDGSYVFQLERELPLKLPERKGNFVLIAEAKIRRGAAPSPFRTIRLDPANFSIEGRKEIQYVDDDFDPPEPIPLRRRVDYILKYRVKGLPEDPAKKIELKETATLYREVKSTAGGQTKITRIKLKSEEKKHNLKGLSGGEAAFERKWWVNIGKGGPHVLEYTIDIPDIPGFTPLKRTRRFNGREDQATLPPTKPSQNVWICQAPSFNRVDFPAYTSKTETSLTAEEEYDGKKSSNTITWTAPPKTIRDGQQVNLTISAPKKEGSFITAEFKLDRSYIKEGTYKGDVDTSTNPGPEEQYGPASQACSFTFESTGSDFEIIMAAAKWNCPQFWVTWKYRRLEPGEEEPKPDDEPPGGGAQDSLGPAGEFYNLFARLEKDILDLVPGDISQICSVYVQGWNPQGDPVEVLMDTVDSFGSLRVNPNIQANPATSSNAPFNIITDSAGEGAFSEMWRARSTAGPGTWLVPIRVRQNKVGEVRLLLTVRILPKKGLPGGPTTPPQPPGGKTGGTGQPGGGAPPAGPGLVVTLGLVGFSWPQNVPAADLKKIEIKSTLVPLERQEERRISIQEGVEAMKKGDWNEAEGIFRACVERFPDDLLFKLLLGHVLYAKNRMPEAMATYQEILAKDQRWAHAHNSLGNVYFVMMNWAEAERCYREAAKTDPKNGEFFANLAGALFMQDRREDASAAAGRAIKLEFTPHWVYEKLGVKYIR